MGWRRRSVEEKDKWKGRSDDPFRALDENFNRFGDENIVDDDFEDDLEDWGGVGRSSGKEEEIN